MFQLFLTNLLRSGGDLKSEDAFSTRGSIPKKLRRNRRMFERFEFNHKHMAVRNADDILMIRDLSEKGFCADVSERCFSRLQEGDQYSCKLRYLGEKFDCDAEVVWKSQKTIGFKLVKPSQVILHFFKRLLIPLEIATSLTRGPSDDQKSQRGPFERVWYYGEYQTILTLWIDHTKELSSWKIEICDQFLSWSKDKGLTKGHRAPADNKLEKPWEIDKIQPYENLPEIQILAQDIFTAAPISYKRQLLETIGKVV